jgi:hypothetical protein
MNLSPDDFHYRIDLWDDQDRTIEQVIAFVYHHAMELIKCLLDDNEKGAARGSTKLKPKRRRSCSVFLSCLVSR